MGKRGIPPVAEASEKEAQNTVKVDARVTTRELEEVFTDMCQIVDQGKASKLVSLEVVNMDGPRIRVIGPLPIDLKEAPPIGVPVECDGLPLGEWKVRRLAIAAPGHFKIIGGTFEERPSR